MQNFEQLYQQAIHDITQATEMTQLESIRVEYLGKKGRLTEILKNLIQLPADERPKVGQLVNDIKRKISLSVDQKASELQEAFLSNKLSQETIDVTLSGRYRKNGSLHPVTQIKNRINEYFMQLGFDVVSGPEIESDFFNFEALNIPSHHPARAMHDTFYFGDGSLLRTHTSPVQIRAMLDQKPPFRLIAPGRVYRCDSDVTHTPMFHQVEGLWIDHSVTMANLKSMLHHFFEYLFDKNIGFRFRPSYFPFTEPSAEMDIECTQCSKEGCRSCKFTGWLEVGGCGMVHPNVLHAVNLSPEQYQGWAFGIGIDRLAMLYYGIDDLRMMFENDLAFLRQF